MPDLNTRVQEQARIYIYQIQIQICSLCNWHYTNNKSFFFTLFSEWWNQHSAKKFIEPNNFLPSHNVFWIKGFWLSYNISHILRKEMNLWIKQITITFPEFLLPHNAYFRNTIDTLKYFNASSKVGLLQAVQKVGCAAQSSDKNTGKG